MDAEEILHPLSILCQPIPLPWLFASFGERSLSYSEIFYYLKSTTYLSSLVSHPHNGLVAGIDEAGRGCLAGPVVAAAVILPLDIKIPLLNDSKKLSHSQRMTLRPHILDQALAWNVGMISAQRIDEINILQATYEAMHEAIEGLPVQPDLLLIDGNRFKAHPDIPHECIIKGDGKYLSIAAASILAKTYRDEVMEMLHQEYPRYNWASNKGYPAKAHKEAIASFGPSPFHRRSFNWSLK